MGRGTLGFGIVRSIDPTKSRARLAELCELLTAELGTLFVPHHADTYRELVDAIETGRVAVAWLPPITSLQLDDSGRGTVLALPVRRGAISYRSALITRRGGPRSLEELRGRRVAWVDPDSSSGFLVPRLYLQGAGYDLVGLFSEERFVRSHAAVVEGLASARFEAGATYCSAEGSAENTRGPWTESAHARSIQVIAMTGLIPNDSIVVGRNVSTDVRSAMLRWLLDRRGPSARQLCADLFGADSFRVGTAEHFEPLRRMLIAARARGTLPPPPA